MSEGICEAYLCPAGRESSSLAYESMVRHSRNISPQVTAEKSTNLNFLFSNCSEFGGNGSSQFKLLPFIRPEFQSQCVSSRATRPPLCPLTGSGFCFARWLKAFL